MSMRLIAVLACCTLSLGLTACNKSSKSGSAGAMQQCTDKCDGKGECCKDKASMGQVGGEKAGCCSEKKDGSMGAVGGECGSKAGSCAEKGSMGQVSGQGACGSKGSCSSKAGC